MHERRRQRQDAVMAEVRRSSVANRRNEPRPGETVEQMRERQHRGWLFMRDLMRRTREREDGTWYMGLDEYPGAASPAEPKADDPSPAEPKPDEG